MVFQKNKLCDTNYNIRMSTDDKARLKKFANELNMPVSYLIRSAVNDYYVKNINKK
jgi:predicted DNA-binding protein